MINGCDKNIIIVIRGSTDGQILLINSALIPRCLMMTLLNFFGWQNHVSPTPIIDCNFPTLAIQQTNFWKKLNKSFGRHFQSPCFYFLEVVYLQAIRSNLYTFNLETINLVMSNETNYECSIII